MVSKKMKCIFCNLETDGTVEHIIPEFLGGSLTINQVCKCCNDKMGSGFEGTVSKEGFFDTYLNINKIIGKSKKLRPLFPNMHLADNPKVSIGMDSQYKPYIKNPKIEKRDLSDGRIAVHAISDERDTDRMIQGVLETLKRHYKKKGVQFTSDDEVEYKKKALENIEYSQGSRIGASMSIDMMSLNLVKS
jgi:hypothetical protein